VLYILYYIYIMIHEFITCTLALTLAATVFKK